MARFASIADMAFAGLVVRIWCIRCARGRELLASDVPSAFAALPLSVVAGRMRCRSCHQIDAIMLLPGREYRPPPKPAIPYDPNYDGRRFAIEFFHAIRAPKKPIKHYPRLMAAISERARLEAAADAVSIDGVKVQSRPISL